MTERGDWAADQEGNLTPPPSDPLVPDTDEFGRDDPAALERERRRRERDLRRRGGKTKSKGKAKKPKRGGGGGLGRIGGRRKARPAPEPERPGTPSGGAATDAPDPTGERPVPGDPTRERPAAPDPTGERPAARQSVGGRAAASRDAIRDRLSRGGGGERPPRRTRGAGGAGNYGRRRLAALAVVFIGILFLLFLVATFQPFAGDGAGEGTVPVEIPEGTSANEAADILDENGVISSASLFKLRLRLAGEDGGVEAGNYTFAEGMSYSAAMDRLTGQDTSGAITVTIPEGLDRTQIAADILPDGVSSDDYLELTKAAPPKFDVTRYGAPKGVSLEGFLFPATYELQAGQGSPELVQQQLTAFQQNIGKVDMSYAQKKNLNVYDVLKIASMIDKEVQVPKERPLVAAVIYNRLNQGIPLGIDATTRFETQNYTEQIPNSDLQADTPFNTRLNQGLTPTPIGNPGLDAIRAAAAPAKVDYTFFVVKPDTCGEHSFTASEKEFEQLAAEYQAALEAEGGSPTSCPE